MLFILVCFFTLKHPLEGQPEISPKIYLVTFYSYDIKRLCKMINYALADLQNDIPEMIEAIEKLRSVIARRRPHPGRLRTGIFLGIFSC